MIDWISTLKSQAEIAARARNWVDSFQQQPGVAFEEASRFQQSVDRSAKAFDHIRRQIMEDATADAAVINAADYLKDIWSDMVIDAHNMIRERLGMRVVPFKRVANQD